MNEHENGRFESIVGGFAEEAYSAERAALYEKLLSDVVDVADVVQKVYEIACKKGVPRSVAKQMAYDTWSVLACGRA